MAQHFKDTLRRVMTLAWQFIKQNGYTMSEALKTAWLNIKNHKALAKGITHFTFRKIDGTIREAWGTIKSEIVPATSGARRTNNTLQTYYDTEKSEWRCYKKANLISIA